MVHVEYAAIANATVVSAIWLPHVAHFAIPSSLCLVTHVETPIRRHDARISHDALVEGVEQVDKKEVVDDEYEEREGVSYHRQVDQKNVRAMDA
jgi:hypothetical protein